MQRYVISDERRKLMRNGFTTGSCAAAASKAAAYMLIGGSRTDTVKINTPAGIVYEANIEDIRASEGEVSCAVRKDSGDDPDITNGTLIYAALSLIYDGKKEVIIDGGEGVGKITRPGLDQPVGNAAINSVPRTMITEAVRDVMDTFDCEDSVKVIISVPGGEELALKTMGPRLGIVGGISIIGTSGIVEPMSTKALLDTIYVELKQLHEEGAKVAVVSPGNYGLDFMRKTYDYDLDKAVKCSNFIGDTIDMVRELGFDKMLLTGHVGKLIKLSGGIMNTHSKEADCRMELMAAAAIRSGASADTVEKILDSVSTEEAYEHLVTEGVETKCFEYMIEKISYYLNKRAGEGLDVQCMVYSNSRGLLGCSSFAEDYLNEARK